MLPLLTLNVEKEMHTWSLITTYLNAFFSCCESNDVTNSRCTSMLCINVFLYGVGTRRTMELCRPGLGEPYFRTKRTIFWDKADDNQGQGGPLLRQAIINALELSVGHSR
ncbi:hypothetical protein ACF0H5_016087 [Mactra antiquata]